MTATTYAHTPKNPRLRCRKNAQFRIREYGNGVGPNCDSCCPPIRLTLTRRRINVCPLQESRKRSTLTRTPMYGSSAIALARSYVRVGIAARTSFP